MYLLPHPSTRVNIYIYVYTKIHDGPMNKPRRHQSLFGRDISRTSGELGRCSYLCVVIVRSATDHRTMYAWSDWWLSISNYVAKQTYISLVSSLTKWTPHTHAVCLGLESRLPLSLLPSLGPIPLCRRFHDFRVYSSTTRTRVRQEHVAPSCGRILQRRRDIGFRRLSWSATTWLTKRARAAINSMDRNPINVYRRAKNE